MDDTVTYNARLASVVQNLLQIYEAPEVAMWLKTPQPRLGDRAPADMLGNDIDYLQVSAIIHQVLDSAFV